jgi:hypothetical protein
MAETRKKSFVPQILSALMSLYMISTFIAAPYFNWRFVQDHGFLDWILWGEIKPTAKALIWPYFAFQHLELPAVDNAGSSRSVEAIRTEHVHNLEKVQLAGTTALYNGQTIDDSVEITMLYGDSTKPCLIDVAKPAVLIEYEVRGSDGKLVYGWEIQPNADDAGCLLEFARFRDENEERRAQ